MKGHTGNNANNLSTVAEHHQKTGHKPDLDNIKVLCREDKDKLLPHKVRETIFIRKETSPTLNRDGAVNFQKLMIPYWKHLDLGRHQRRVPGVNQSVNIQLLSAKRTEKGFSEIF